MLKIEMAKIEMAKIEMLKIEMLKIEISKNWNMEYQSHGKSKVRLKYHSLEVDTLIKKDKVKEIEGIADDF